MTSITVNGTSYSDDGSTARDMQDGGHRQWFFPLLQDALADFAAKQAAAASANGVLAINFTFSTTTGDADPTAGKVRLNNATQNSSTAIRVDLLDSLGEDWTSVIDSFDDSTSTVKGQVRLAKVADGSKWITFDLTAKDSSSGYRNLTVSVTGSSDTNPFADGDPLLLTFTRTGDKGTTGNTGANGSNGTNGADGSPKLLSVVPASGALSALVDDTFDSTYDVYLIIGCDLTVSVDGAALRAQFELANSIDTGANYKYHSQSNTSGGTTYSSQANTGHTYINMILDIGNAASKCANIMVWVFKPTSTSHQKAVRYEGTAFESGNNPVVISGTGSNTSTSALTGIEFYPSSGTITGTFYLFGLKKS